MLCVVALLGLGISHRIPAYAGNGPAVDLSAYVLPDGTLPELCHSLDDDGSHGSGTHDSLATVCEACRIVAGILLPSPADVTGVPLARRMLIALPIWPETMSPPVLVVSTAPRAPPATFSAISL